MLLTETVRRVKDERELINDPAQYPSSAPSDQYLYNATEYSTSSTSWVLIDTFTLNPSGGLKPVIRKLQADLRNNLGSPQKTWLRVTAQPTGGSEVDLWITTYAYTNYGTVSTIVGYVPSSAVTVTVRFYIHGSGAGDTAYCKNRYVYYYYQQWQTTKNYGTINIESDKTLLFYKFTASSAQLGGAVGGFRLKLGSLYAAAGVLNNETKTLSGFILLNAGQYSVVFEADSGYVSVKDFVLGIYVFTYTQGLSLAQTSGGDIALNLSAHKILGGYVNEGYMEIRCAAYTPNDQTNFQNPGESLTNPITLQIDTIEKPWSERINDTYGFEAAYAAYKGALEAEQHTITITRGNSNTVLYVSIIFSPWILGSVETAPFSLNIPPGSTIYVVLAPLTSDPTKTIKLKAARFLVGGEDYISQASGTGVLIWNYTFEYVDPAEALITIVGEGGCIQLYAVDIR
jgi:hypothetical protein